jgi:hypothetical protein
MKQKNSEKNLSQYHFFPQQVPQVLTWTRTRASAVRPATNPLSHGTAPIKLLLTNEGNYWSYNRCPSNTKKDFFFHVVAYAGYDVAQLPTRPFLGRKLSSGMLRHVGRQKFTDVSDVSLIRAIRKWKITRCSIPASTYLKSRSVMSSVL